MHIRMYLQYDHTMNFFAVSALNLIAHVGFSFVFAVTNDLGLMLYKQFLGETASRGYTPGSITRLARQSGRDWMSTFPPQRGLSRRHPPRWGPCR